MTAIETAIQRLLASLDLQEIQSKANIVLIDAELKELDRVKVVEVLSGRSDIDAGVRDELIQLILE